MATKLNARLRKIMAEIDDRMTEATGEFLRTRDDTEKRFGLKVARPSGVVWQSLKKGTCSDLEALIEAGVITVRETSLGTIVARAGVPADYYVPSVIR